jgi:hypothetical protein
MKKIDAKLQNDRGITLVAVLMVLTILLSVIGAGLLFSGINTKITGNYQVGTKAFYAADTGINAAIGQLSESTSAATAALSGTLSSGLGYRSGHRTDSGAQPMVYKGTIAKPGYKLNRGSGYNTSGYTYQQYQLNMTGTYTTTWGTEVAGREIEAQAVYGPVSR